MTEFFINLLLHISIIFLLTKKITKILLIINTEYPFINNLIDIYNNDILLLYLIGYLCLVFIIPIFLILIIDENNKNKLKIPEISSSKVADKFYRFILPASVQYLNENVILKVFLGFFLINIVSFRFNSKRKNRMYY